MGTSNRDKATGFARLMARKDIREKCVDAPRRSAEFLYYVIVHYAGEENYRVREELNNEMTAAYREEVAASIRDNVVGKG